MIRETAISSGLLGTLALATVLATGCTPQQGTHLGTEVPENHARIHQPNYMKGQIDEGELAATESPKQAKSQDADGQGGVLIIATNIAEACEVKRAKAFFDYDSAKLGDSAEDTLEQIAWCFEDGPMRYQALRIVGHADPRGSAEYNEELGEDRASAVADYLKDEGLASRRLETVSMGEAMASDDPDDWARDRKVVLELGS